MAAAAAAYFGKDVKDLSAAEAAMLAGLPKAPGRATPFHDFARAQARQRYVIDQMQDLGFLTPAEAETARREAVVLVSRDQSLTNVAAPYFVETIRRYVADNYGDEELLERGLRIYTTLDMRKQRAAEAAVRNGLAGSAAAAGLGRADRPPGRRAAPPAAERAAAAVRSGRLPDRRRGAGRSSVDAGRAAGAQPGRRRADRRHRAGRRTYAGDASHASAANAERQAAQGARGRR